MDAHAHAGYFGGWCDVGIRPEEMLAQMELYNIEKTVIYQRPMRITCCGAGRGTGRTFDDTYRSSAIFTSVEAQRSLVSGLEDDQLKDEFYNNVKKLLKL